MTRRRTIVLAMFCFAGRPALADQTSSRPGVAPEPQRVQFGWDVGMGIGAAKMVDDAGLNLGLSIVARGGIEILAPGSLAFIPELAVDYSRWSTEPSLQPDLTNLWTLGLLAGMRLAGRSPAAVPWFAFHLGLNHSDASGTFCNSVDCSSNHLGFDAGAGVAFRASPTLKLGLFARYSRRELTSSTDNWLSFGVEGFFAR